MYIPIIPPTTIEVAVVSWPNTDTVVFPLTRLEVVTTKLDAASVVFGISTEKTMTKLPCLGGKSSSYVYSSYKFYSILPKLVFCVTAISH